MDTPPSPARYAKTNKAALELNYVPTISNAPEEFEYDWHPVDTMSEMADLAFPLGTGPTNCPDCTDFHPEQHEVLMIGIISCAVYRKYPHTKPNDDRYKAYNMYGLGLGVDIMFFLALVKFLTDTVENSEGTDIFRWTSHQEKALRCKATVYKVNPSTVDNFLNQIHSIEFHWCGLNQRISPLTCKEAALHAIRMAINNIPMKAKSLKMPIYEFVQNEEHVHQHCREWYTPLFQHATYQTPFSEALFFSSTHFLLNKIYLCSTVYPAIGGQSSRLPVVTNQKEYDPDIIRVAREAFPLGTGPTFQTKNTHPHPCQIKLATALVVLCSLNFLSHQNEEAGKLEERITSYTKEQHGLALGFDENVFQDLVQFVIRIYSKEKQQLILEQDGDPHTTLIRQASRPGIFPIHQDSLFTGFLSTVRRSLLCQKFNDKLLSRVLVSPEELEEAIYYGLRCAVNSIPFYAHHYDYRVEEVTDDRAHMEQYFRSFFVPQFSHSNAFREFSPNPDNFSSTLRFITSGMYIPEYSDTPLATQDVYPSSQDSGP